MEFNKDKISLKAFCITINSRKEYDPIEEIKHLGFSNVNYIQGVNGSKLSESDIRKYLSPRAYYELKNGRYVHEALSGTGSIGCYLAHVKAWEECLKNKEKIAIFEDDFVSYPNSREELYNSINEAEKIGYDILRLNHRHNPDYDDEYEEIPNSKFVININRTEGATAYIITPYAASKLLSTCFPIDMQIDSYIDMGSFYHNLRNLSTKKDFFNDQQVSSLIQHNTLKNYKNGINLHTFRRNKYLVYILVLIGGIILIYFLSKRKYKY